MSELLYIIWIPFAAGLLLMAVPESMRKLTGLLSAMASALAFVFSIILYTGKGLSGQLSLVSFPLLAEKLPGLNQGISSIGDLNFDEIARLMIMLISFFSFIVIIYSLRYTSTGHRIKKYYSYILFTMVFSILAVISNNLLFFLFCWGILCITLYKIIKGSDDEGAAAAKKTMIIVGASDTILLLGIAIIQKVSGSFNIIDAGIQTNSALEIIAFFCLLIGAFTKAGAVPFHTWVPDFSKKAPASSTALLPASIDKLLGIYFMFRICTDIFTLNEWITLVLVIIGVMTIIIGVMMALAQHNMKQLLGYHAVSQVGYMVLGLGLGTPLGIAGGLFHMVNNALYKSGLFLVAGNVESRFGTDEIGNLGVSPRYMPFTFTAALIFALSISGIPPLNGFASKWVIYQGIIDFGSGIGIANKLWIIWLGLAVLGSALTLASFIKLLAGVFFRNNREPRKGSFEVKPVMFIPVTLLAGICLLTGIFATTFVIPKIIAPLTGSLEYDGSWQSGLVSIMVIISIVVGILVYLAASTKKFRTDDSFIGGEPGFKTSGLSALDFYKTVTASSFFAPIYRAAEKKWFDIYDMGKGIILYFNSMFRAVHTGILPFYISWLISGLVLLLIIMLI